MAGLENLFAAEPTLPSVQKYRMPENPEKWSEVLTTLVRERYPDASKLPMTIEFRKRDDQSGTAIGAIHVVSVEAEKSLYIPFIVQKWELFPLDVWMEAKSQAVHPLRQDTLKEQFFTASMADGTDPRPTDSAGQYFNDPSMWTTNYPPLQGRYSYASAGYPLLDALSDTFRAEEAEAFKQALKNEPGLLLGFQKHGHQELITKLAAKSYPNTQDFVASAEKLIPHSVVDVKRESYDKYSILSASENIWDTISSVQMNREDCYKFLSRIAPKADDILHAVDQEGEKTLVIKAPSDKVFLFDVFEQAPEEANEFSVYTVKGRGGVSITGVFVPNVVDLSGKKKPMKLFVSKTHASFQPSIAGVRHLEDKKIESFLQPSAIRLGQTGSFMFIDSGGIVATIPLTIKALESHGQVLRAVDLNGTEVTVKRDYGDHIKRVLPPEQIERAQLRQGKEPGYRLQLDAHAFVETKPNTFMIPSRMVWVPLEDMADVTKTPSEWMEKEAFSKMEDDPVVVQWTGSQFLVYGNGLEKRAYDARQARVLLANKGVDLKKVAKAMEVAKRKGKAKLHNTAQLITKISWQETASKKATTLKKLAKSLRVDLIKEASKLGDKSQTVDALLSLGFINPENLSKFVSYRSLFVKCGDYLAELVLASRMGLGEVDEAAAVSAMTKLLDVSDSLGKLEGAMIRPSSKAS
jgi:hypothetical protein